MKRAQSKVGPELIYGLVGAVGTDLDSVCSLLKDSLKEHDYSSDVLKLSGTLRELHKTSWPALDETSEDTRIDSLMTRGNLFREDTAHGDALAVLSLTLIQQMRIQKLRSDSKAIPRHAYILKSLKHPDEVRTLRKIYRSNFILISVYAQQEVREQKLKLHIAKSRHQALNSGHQAKASELMIRDEAEEMRFGQNVRETFPLADVFLDASRASDLKNSLRRFQDLFFGGEYCTPSKDEYAMAHASIAALRSASMARQVGAAIAADDGEIIALGTNDVPKAGGGLYWEGDDPDGRDFKYGYDISDINRIDVLAEVLTKLKDGGWLSESQKQKTVDQLLEEALFQGDRPILKKSQLMDIIEYGRAVHAEMAAICFAARRGIPVRDCTLYTTTFPCHECARLIVAAGIKKIVYIEPYPKSRTRELYFDSIQIDKKEQPGYVGCVPFIGVTPRQYLRLFSGDEKRRKIRGEAQRSDKGTALPLIMDMPPANYITNEKISISQLKEICDKVGIKIKKGGRRA